MRADPIAGEKCDLPEYAPGEQRALETQTKENTPIPWHPGALKYLAERGVKM